MIIAPLSNVSKEHNQPNCLWKRSKKKNQKLQNRYTGSVKSKRNMTVRPSRIEAYKLKMVTKKKGRVVLWYHNHSEKKKDARYCGAGG